MSLKLRYKEDKEIDIIDKVSSRLIEVKYSEKWRQNYSHSLLNNDLLKEFGMELFSKNVIYLGETKDINGITLWNIYDFEKEILKEEHLLELNPYYKETSIISWGNGPNNLYNIDF